jgi:hypothetical protein
MSISPLSSFSTLLSSAQTPQSSRRQDFAQLANALQSGNLSGAQQAYAALQQAQGAQTASGTSTSNNPVTTDFAALGKALESGNLNGAQSAFSQLQTDIKSAQGTQQGSTGAATAKGHHHHHHGRSEPEPSTTTSTSTSNTPTSTSVNLLG